MKTQYSDRLNISIEKNTINLYTKCDTYIASGYNRIVIGDRGPYIEFTKDQLILENIFIPDYAKYRIDDDNCYYLEYRSNDICDIKIYFQKRCVDYADYLVNYFYISPFDLKSEFILELIRPIHHINNFSGKFFK